MLALAEILAHFPPSKRHGKHYRTVCPVHGDAPAHPSLEIAEGYRGILFTCRTKGCPVADILAAAGLTWGDVLPDRMLPANGSADFSAIYDYRDASGVLRYQVCRKATSPGEPKAFVQRHPDANGGWIWRMDGIERLPYRLHELRGHTTVFVCEGEKDVDRLWSLGLPATCNTGGAKKWRDGDSAQLKAAGVERCILLTDHDPAGTAHVVLTAENLTKHALTCLVLPPFPHVPPGGDVSDWLDAGGTLDGLKTLVRQAGLPPVRLAVIGLHTMLEEPEELTQWIVEDRIPAGSVCLLVAKPKVGKTTAARHLAVAVARGDVWLGSECRQGLVWYLGLEGRKADHLSHFRQFNMTSEEAARIRCYIGPATPTLLADMRAQAAEDHPSLIVVDTLQRLLQVKSMDDYAEVTKAFDPIIACARETGAALLLIHHAGKSTDREALDTVLGSTAIAGSVDNTIVLAKLAGFRTMTTRQRIGPDSEERVIQLTDDGRVILGDLRDIAERRVLMRKLYDALANAPTRLTTAEWIELVEGRKQSKLAAIRLLVSDGTVSVTGIGKPNNPFIYSVPTVPTVPVGSQTVPEPTQDRFLK